MNVCVFLFLDAKTILQRLRLQCRISRDIFYYKLTQTRSRKSTVPMGFAGKYIHASQHLVINSNNILHLNMDIQLS